MALPDRPLTRVETFLDAIANGDASGLPTPLSREEQFLSAIANKDASGLPPPLTREEQYLLAIASGDASGIPAIPLTREEQYLGAIANGSDSYPSIPLTRTEQYLEYIAENGGGGSLEESGWWTKGGLATVVGNTVDFPAGSTSTDLEIKPPTDIDANRRFHADDVFQIAIKINAVSKYLYAQLSTNSNAVLVSKNNILAPTGASTGQGYASTTGEDVLTWTFTGNSTYIKFSPRSTSSSASSVQSANFEITGMKFNGNVIYGKV